MQVSFDLICSQCACAQRLFNKLSVIAGVSCHVVDSSYSVKTSQWENRTCSDLTRYDLFNYLGWMSTLFEIWIPEKSIHSSPLKASGTPRTIKSRVFLVKNILVPRPYSEKWMFHDCSFIFSLSCHTVEHNTVLLLAHNNTLKSDFISSIIFNVHS